MNRNEEFNQLLEALETQAPSLESSVTKARRRRHRKHMVLAPLGSAAAVFALFVVLVNSSTTVAYACSQIPFIRELAAAVTFSPSLTDAVDNEYVQSMNLVQEQNGITAKVESLIVDQKQVNVFYRLDSEKYAHLEADLDVLVPDGSDAACSISNNSFNLENGALRHMDIDYTNQDVPDALRLIIKVYSNDDADTAAPSETQDRWDIPVVDKTYLAQFDFLLKFDPKFTEVGKSIPINQTLDLGGQKITFTNVEIYPSHMRVDVQSDSENSAWLKSLDFHILANGKRFDPISDGIVATGSAESQEFTSYRADSPYFHDSDSLELVVAGATWLDKENPKVHLNLKTGEHDALPQGIEFRSAVPYKDSWTVSFRAPLTKDGGMYQLLSTCYWDAEGTQYVSDTMSHTFDREGLKGDQPSTHFIQEFPLRDYPYDEVWLGLIYSYSWTPAKPITIPIR